MNNRIATYFRIRFSLALAVLLILSAPVFADAPQPDEQSRSTAVALNYCRASFHRIRRYPSKRVLMEEQEKILNNLNLNQIADEEVVRLYTSVLDEINHVQIAEKDKKFIRDSSRRTFTRQLAISAFQFGTQLATTQYGAAIRTGAHSWWDYRSMVFHRDTESWKIEKLRMEALVDKSSQFLDTFWKLARKRSIPDRWLVRSRDLDELEKAMREQNLEVRLRILRRMEHFMECYPPYLYYVARTQQALGQLFAAEKTYQKLLEIGDSHFRKDEMLAAGLANQAVIQEYLQQPSAVQTAQTALRHSTDVWEVNLMCARILERNKQFIEAEDAILRNLDVDLEQRQSRVCLLSLYYHSNNSAKLAALLDDADVARSVSADVLLQCASLLEGEQIPRAVVAALRESLYGHFGRHEFALRAARSWQLDGVRMSMTFGDHVFGQPRLTATSSHYEVRMRRTGEIPIGTQFQRDADTIIVTLHYSECPVIHLALRQIAGPAPDVTGNTSNPAGLLVSVLKIHRNVYQLTSAIVGKRTLNLRAGNLSEPAITPEPTLESAPPLTESNSPASTKSSPLPALPPLPEAANSAKPTVNDAATGTDKRSELKLIAPPLEPTEENDSLPAQKAF